MEIRTLGRPAVITNPAAYTRPPRSFLNHRQLGKRWRVAIVADRIQTASSPSRETDAALSIGRD